VRYPSDDAIGLQITAGDDDGCQFILRTAHPPGDAPAGKTMTCSGVSVSDSLGYHAAFKRGASLLEIDAGSMAACRSFMDGITRAAEPVVQEGGAKVKKGEPVAAAAPPPRVEVVSECKEKQNS